VTEGKTRSRGQRRLARALVVFAVVAVIWFLITRVLGGPDEAPEATPAVTSTTAQGPASTTSALAGPDEPETTTTTQTLQSPTSTPNLEDTSLYVVDAAGGSGVFLAPGSQPVWAPDGSRIAFTAPADEGGSAVYSIEAAGGAGIFLAPGSEPSWAPDSSRIAFTAATEDGGSAVYVVDAAGGSGVFLAPGSQPVWAPDGSRIAFTAPAG